VWKVHLSAKNYPEVGSQSVLYADLNTELKVIPLNTMAKQSIVEGFEEDTIDEMSARKQMVLTNEVKKVGVIIDRGQCMQFRPGDELIVYISMGGFEK